MSLEFQLLAWLTVKHFICDFPLQAHPYQYLNKGTYGHLGGLLHSFIHYVGAALVFCQFLGVAGLVYASADAIAHYHIDWSKVKIGKRFNLKPDNSEWFWILLGFDQLLHFAGYFALVAYAVI